MTDQELMRLALREAREAASAGEVPIGCVVLLDGEVIGRGRNRRETDQDPVAHAEILALRAAAKKIGSWRLDGATVASTLEPCPMCAGALVAARVRRLIFGTIDPKAGAVGTLYNLAQDPRLNHEISVTCGVLDRECSQLISEFFKDIRTRKINSAS